jgi:hypothetical protein
MDTPNPARQNAAEAIVRSVARATDPYVALFLEQPEEGFVCGFCGEDRGEPHNERCPWYAASLFVMQYPAAAANENPKDG